MSAWERFAVVRLPFPFTDRQAQSCGHLLLALITSARQSAAGLSQACVVRLKLFTLDERLVLGRLGVLAAADRTAVAAQLAKLLPPVP